MKLRHLLDDIRGATAIEFAMTAPVFVMVIVGAIQSGIMLWTQLGLQQGVEMGARCASVNSIVCGTTSAIQNYAALKTYGVNPSPSAFTVTTEACGIQVSANYPLPVLSSYFDIATLRAKSCFPQ